MIKVNGENVENITGKNITEFLKENSYDLKRVAVEINGDILLKSKYENTVIQNGDCIEIVSFVGGG